MSVTTWQLDPVHANIGFSVRHMMVAKVRGRFTNWTGTLEFDAERPEAARATARIDAASIDTAEPQRDAHLRSPDFFDAEHFPAITFASTKVEPAGDGRFKVAGDLTIRGVTKPIVLDAEFGGIVTDLQGKTRAGFSATASIDRKAFGLVWNMVLEAGGLAVADRVDIAIEVEAVLAQAEAAVAAGSAKAVA